jgi:hypothetical protein
MPELVPTEHDDIAFLSLVQRIINGAIAVQQIREVYLVHIDNWFDHKWLGWWSRWRNRKAEELRVPLFNPNRVRSEKHFVWDGEKSVWTFDDLAKPLHIRQAGRPWLAQPLDRFSKCAAFTWYSGNTTTNKVGSLMFYLSGPDVYAWYAAFKKEMHWAVADEFQITRRELLSFEERSHHMEVASKIIAANQPPIPEVSKGN